MGLDITAYEAVRPAPNGDILISEDEFRRFEDLTPGRYISRGRELYFSAGSYRGYNAWRSALAILVGTTDREVWAEQKSPVVQAMPFFELICFSDCEGTIGPKTSAKLACDFDSWAERATKYAPHEYWLSRYEQWRKAFRLAAWRGIVDFK